MKLSQIELPSNKKFGVFFTAIFVILGGYFYFEEKFITGYVFGAASVTFLIITLLKEDLLLPLNKLWMQFGFLLGMIISPIVLGIIFFLLFTPIGIVIRISGRDELRLKLKKNQLSHWVNRQTQIEASSFKLQF